MSYDHYHDFFCSNDDCEAQLQVRVVVTPEDPQTYFEPGWPAEWEVADDVTCPECGQLNTKLEIGKRSKRELNKVAESKPSRGGYD